MSNHQQAIRATVYDKRGRVLAVGHNSYTKTHPLQKQYADRAKQEHRIFLHAEMAAIIGCKDKAKAHRIVVERFFKSGEPAPAAPCPICMAAIKDLTSIQVIEHT